MNREIKFRAFCPKLKVMSKPFSFNQILNFGDVVFNSLDLKKHIVMQFTGLKDKNGVDIYEGDILDSSEKVPMIFEVYYEEGGFKYGTRDRSVDIGFSGHRWLENILSRFHVIGNIHSNPELLNNKS